MAINLLSRRHVTLQKKFQCQSTILKKNGIFLNTPFFFGVPNAMLFGIHYTCYLHVTVTNMYLSHCTKATERSNHMGFKKALACIWNNILMVGIKKCDFTIAVFFLLEFETRQRYWFLLTA